MSIRFRFVALLLRLADALDTEHSRAQREARNRHLLAKAMEREANADRVEIVRECREATILRRDIATAHRDTAYTRGLSKLREVPR